MKKSAVLALGVCVIAAIFIVAGRNSTPMPATPRYPDVKPQPCLLTNGEAIEFVPKKHSYFLQNKLDLSEVLFGEYTSDIDVTAVHYDPQALEAYPNQYRTFILDTACLVAKESRIELATSTNAPDALPLRLKTECAVIKDLRDKDGYTKQDIDIIARQIAYSSLLSEDNSSALTRSVNVLSCFMQH